MKIDNLDMSEKNVRIVDFKGQPSFKGRVEFRVNGNWGTLCSASTEPKMATVLCKSLKYVSGIYRNTEASSYKDCKDFMGENHCGAVV